jgi:hypothetical protein
VQIPWDFTTNWCIVVTHVVVENSFNGPGFIQHRHSLVWDSFWIYINI